MPRKLTKTWYNSFVDCTLPHTEAPRSYLEWAAFSVLGGVLKNHVYYDEGLYTLYPNQFIILVGPPSVGKGTAVNFAWDMVDKSTNPYKLANLIEDRVTAPRILQRIEAGWPIPPQVAAGGQVVTSLREHTCTIKSTELRVLLTASDWMLEFLCECWDKNAYSYDTKNMGTNTIKNMCTSLIGATVPDFIRGLEKDVDSTVAGGFSSRCLFIFEDKKSKDLPFAPALKNNPKSLDLYQKLLDDLDYISKNLRGEYKMSQEAKIAFSNFYPTIAPEPADSDAMLHFKGRMKAHIIKTAMILAAGRKDDLVLEGVDMRVAIQLISNVQRKLDRVFRGAGNSRLAETSARVITCVEKASMCTKRELQRTLARHVTPEDLDKTLWLLLEIGHLREIVNSSGNGRTVYYALPKPITPNPTAKP